MSVSCSWVFVFVAVSLTHSMHVHVFYELFAFSPAFAQVFVRAHSVRCLIHWSHVKKAHTDSIRWHIFCVCVLILPLNEFSRLSSYKCYLRWIYPYSKAQPISPCILIYFVNIWFCSACTQQALYATRLRCFNCFKGDIQMWRDNHP